MNISDDIKEKEKLLSSLNSCLKDIISQFQIISDKIENLSNIFDDLQKVYSKKTPIENSNLGESFTYLKEVMNKWKKGYENQKKFFQFDFRYLFKFMKNELIEFSKFSDEFEETKNAFDSYRNEENNKTKMIIHNYYGFYCNRLVDEYTDLHLRQNQRIKNNFDMNEEERKEFFECYTNFIKLFSESENKEVKPKL